MNEPAPIIGTINGDGFEILLYFHRMTGILYLGYGQSVTKWKQICLLAWGILVWMWVIIHNTPCLVTCFHQQFKNILALYIFNATFVILSAINVFSAIVYTTRGHRFLLLIDDLNKSVVNKKSLKTLRIIVVLYIIVTIFTIIAKIALLKRIWSFYDIFRTMEDIFSEIMTDQTGLLLVYLSHYISIIIQELNESIKKSYEMTTNDINFDELYEKITKIQKLIKRANRILNPCLILMFILHIFFLISIGFFIQNSSKSLSKGNFSYEYTSSLILIFALRMLTWCLFVDKLNQKVNFKSLIDFICILI